MSASSYDGTVQEVPLVETNPEGRPRSILVKRRKLGGNRGSMIRTALRIPLLAIAFFDDDWKKYDRRTSRVNLSLSHQGIQVGSNLWELHTDQKHAKTLAVQRLNGPQIWESNYEDIDAGTTTLTDRELNFLGDLTSTRCMVCYSTDTNAL
jgi:hypothetical protein